MKNKFYFLGLLLVPIMMQAQDDCASRLSIVDGTMYTVNAVDGTQAIPTTCSGGGLGTNAEWYSYIPTAAYTVTIESDNLSGGNSDTKVNVYTGSCATLVCFDGDDDGGNGTLSSVTFDVVAGTEYIIAWDNNYSSGGFTFTLDEVPYVPPVPAPVTFSAATYASIAGNYNIAVVDMNGDFLDDIVTVSGSTIQIQYQQTSGVFNVVSYTTPAAAYEPTWSLAAGDIDKNGFTDLMYGDGTGVSFMMANNTGTGFTQSYTTDYVFCQRTNMVDINNDGHLDAFSCHDVDPNVYYLNDGTGALTFYQGGLGDHSEGGNYGSVWVDYDNDGDPDLFIAKCRGGASTAKINELHRNDGAGNFTDVSIASNMADPVQTWSSAWNDYDNNGLMDAVIGASSTSDGTHKFMRNNGDGTFSDITAGSGWDTNTSLNIEHCTYDFDNDGYTDVMGGGNKIMFNDGDMTFSPVPVDFGPGAIGDLNNDGFLDVRNGNTIYYSNGNDNNWVKVNLTGIQSNGNGIGARVEIYGSWGKQIRDIRSGEGFRYMSTLNAHFGIGTATEIDSIFVKWPSGHIDNIINPDINTSVTVVEGSSPLSVLTVDGKKVNLYPNPTSDFVVFENIDLLEVESISVISYNGSEVINVVGSTDKLDVAHLTSGLYIVKITTKDGKKYSETFVKQ